MSVNPTLSTPPVPPAPSGMPGPVAPPAASSASGGAAGPQTASGSTTPPSTGVPSTANAQAGPPTVPGCFHVDVRTNAIQFDYDAACQSQITQDQLDLLGQIRKTEAALIAIFYPTGLPSDLRLRKPPKPVSHSHVARSASGSAVAAEATRTARAQVQQEEHDAETEQAAADKDKAKKRAEKKKAKFRSYFYALFLLAQLGLDGPKAQPWLARNALTNLKDQILTLEAGRIKNGYMQDLGINAVSLGGGPLVLILIYEAIRYSNGGTNPPGLNNHVAQIAITLLFTWLGAMIGTFLSFALRNPVFSFDQLAVPEEDRMNPGMRLLYVGLLALIVIIALKFKVFTVSMGSLNTLNLDSAPSIGFLIGTFCGISERAIGEKLLKSADTFAK